MLPRMRLFPATSLLCVIDVQERLLAVVPEADRVVARCRRLAEAARAPGRADGFHRDFWGQEDRALSSRAARQ